MLPLSVAFLLTAKTKKQRIISAIAVVLMIFVWIGCNSRAGYLGIAVASIFALWLFRKVLIKNWKVSVSVFAVFVVMLVGLNSASEGRIFNRLRVFNVKQQIENLKIKDNRYANIEDILVEDNIITILTDKEKLSLKIDGDKLFFLDESNNELPIETKNNIISINDEKYSRYKIVIPKNYPGVTLKIEEPWKNRDINFYITNDGIKVLGSGGRITEPIVGDRFTAFDGFESFMSGRGYIWGRTIPMLKTYFIKGSGADNYPIAFPQDDFVAKLRNGSDASLVIDKPHNMYMQIGINTGVISLIALISVWVLYIVSSLKLYTKITFNSLEKIVGASCLVSIIGYLAAAMFNDHIISVSPVFWLILGIGISINNKYINNN
jgi:hypothetical protein